MLHAEGTQLTFTGEHHSLLDFLEQHRVPIEAQCRAGHCGTCRIRLLRGQVTYQQQPLACIRRGEILPCCCIPTLDVELDL